VKLLFEKLITSAMSLFWGCDFKTFDFKIEFENTIFKNTVKRLVKSQFIHFVCNFNT
jgi:hypothetical protein